MDNPHYISKEGLEKLKLELEERKNRIRPEIAKRILEATGFGDLSENAEYTEAKEMQAFNQGRIEELEDIIRNASIIDNGGKKPTLVSVGTTVAVQFRGKKQEFTIVGASESAPAQGLISNESPLGKAFVGKKKGEEVKVTIPKGTVTYKIINIS
ncbi:MAG: transcription elongation factor GreA [Candidatus Yanofskybacteria bacterium CG10_big_fil_rev_8_21_14_0_10_46_23]|uniref:Transcription elongation factor GreA n=1 Tax=Candidatus Yanofskybacteria bacterium CG10_big_fil_rev_8_21_14_0_10_46_23 TaxID=1975098 RepID=A0A2H0R4H9_9BACT|nr:MAG: transcription elongation factor GreA [Candidatus Yanofskybacteria bacterium CG10_big_fil_rev_8_21_14_0_10_46_23]